MDETCARPAGREARSAAEPPRPQRLLLEVLDPGVEGLLVLLDGLGRAEQLDLVRVLRALQLNADEAEAGLLALEGGVEGRGVVGPADVEHDRGMAGDLQRRLLVGGGGLELGLPAGDVLRGRAAQLE